MHFPFTIKNGIPQYRTPTFGSESPNCKSHFTDSYSIYSEKNFRFSPQNRPEKKQSEPHTVKYKKWRFRAKAIHRPMPDNEKTMIRKSESTPSPRPLQHRRHLLHRPTKQNKNKYRSAGCKGYRSVHDETMYPTSPGYGHSTKPLA